MTKGQSKNIRTLVLGGCIGLIGPRLWRILKKWSWKATEQASAAKGSLILAVRKV
jgi:hypothetical protein